jgi:hypothetical protein
MLGDINGDGFSDIEAAHENAQKTGQLSLSR